MQAFQSIEVRVSGQSSVVLSFEQLHSQSSLIGCKLIHLLLAANLSDS